MTEADVACLKSKYRYDPETGFFHWIAESGGHKQFKPGDKAGLVYGRGYVYLFYKARKKVLAHRFAYACMTGKWPALHIDHINGVKTDNRWSNLREATHSQNLWNRAATRKSVSGLKGVRQKTPGRWTAEIKKNNVKYHLGTYDTAKLAYDAYIEAAERLHGEFARVA
jgi:hypothetical protein